MLAALVSGACAWHWNHGPALGADDHGQYLLHARALVDGRAYTDIGFIHTPFTTLSAPVAEPAAFPAAIALIFATVGESIAGVRLLLVVSLLLFALAVWRYWQKTEGHAIAFVVAAWSVVALTRLHVLDTVLADLPFAAALWGVFAIADTAGRPLRGKHFAALALLGVAAFGFRMAALPLLPAILMFVFVRLPAERKGLAFVSLVWMLSALAVLYLLPGAAALGSEVSRTPADILRDVRVNFNATLEGARHWVPVTLPWPTADVALQGTLLIIAALGAIVALREQPRRFAYITACWYVLMLVALPTRSSRYLWPLYPLLTFALIRGGYWLLDRIGIALGGRAPRIGVGVAALLLALGLLQDARSPAPRTLAGDRDTQQVFDALRREANSGPPPRVAFFSPRVLTWETGITATVFGSGSPAEIHREVVGRGLTHVVVGDAATAALGTEATARMVQAHAQSFVRVFQNASFVVHRVIAAGLVR